MKKPGDMDLVEKVQQDFKASNSNISEDEIKSKLDEFFEKAKVDFQ